MNWIYHVRQKQLLSSKLESKNEANTHFGCNSLWSLDIHNYHDTWRKQRNKWKHRTQRREWNMHQFQCENRTYQEHSISISNNRLENHFFLFCFYFFFIFQLKTFRFYSLFFNFRQSNFIFCRHSDFPIHNFSVFKYNFIVTRFPARPFFYENPFSVSLNSISLFLFTICWK